MEDYLKTNPDFEKEVKKDDDQIKFYDLKILEEDKGVDYDTKKEIEQYLTWMIK